jgi:hypothetical protein
MSICLILLLADRTLLPIPAPFPDSTYCEMGGLSMTDGNLVRGYICVPAVIYDCRKAADS